MNGRNYGFERIEVARGAGKTRKAIAWAVGQAQRSQYPVWIYLRSFVFMLRLSPGKAP